MSNEPDNLDVLRVLAPAKVNLGLSILGRREDGYHEIDSVFCAVSLYDEVLLSPAGSGPPTLSVDGPGPKDASNLAWRAAEAYGRAAGRPSGVSIALAKRIPIGAGLGGGSSDAGAVLRGLAARDGVHPESLDGVARSLGADVPYFLRGRPARVRGIGDRIERLEGFRTMSLVLVHPGFEISTAWAYAAFDAALTSIGGADKIRRFDHGARDFENDFEGIIARKYPEILEIKAELIRFGARAASLSGSGSAVFGVVDDLGRAESIAKRLEDAGRWARAVETLEEMPGIEREVGDKPAGGR